MVDILMATYNGGKYVSQQIDSIINQSYKDIKLIIRDDGSNDNTIDILEKYKDKYPDIIELVEDHESTRSATGNFMRLTKYAKSDYVMFCDQDDIWDKEKIKKSLEEIKAVEERIGSSKPILVFCRYRVVDENLKQIKPESDINVKRLELNRLIVQNYITGCLSIVNKSLYSIMGDYNESIMMHDWWVALIASALGEIKYIPETLMLYRQHGDNSVGDVDTRSLSFNASQLQKGNVKNLQYKYRDQIELFEDRYRDLLDSNSKRIIENYINLFSENKLKRMIGIIKGKYYKDTLIRVFGQLIYV